MATRESLLGPPKRQNPALAKPVATAKRKSRATMGGRLSAQQKSRPSTATAAPGSRRSSRTSVYGSAPPVKKDPRPLSDKGYQQSSIRRLCAHLAENGYPQEVKPRALQSPSTKDFVYILNFLLAQIDESLMINGFKLDEEVPMILKQLGYPFNVSKHHLLSVGSPHSWPIILGVLMWLVDGTIEDTSTQLLFSKGFEFDDEGGENQDEERFLMEAGIYQCFMQHGIESEQYQTTLKSIKDSFGHLCQMVLEKLGEVTEMTTQLEHEVEQLSYSSIQSLQGKITATIENRTAFVGYIDNELLPRMRKLEELCQEQEAAVCRTEMQITAADERSTSLQEQISKQPMSSKEARKIKQGIKDHREKAAMLRVETDECHQQVQELQMQHNRSVMNIDKNSREVNDKLRKLAAIVPDAASLPTMDYDGSKRAEPVVLNQLVAQTKIIKQGLQEVNQRVAAILSETEAKVINADSIRSQYQSTITAKQFEIENSEHTVEIEMTALQQKKRKHEGQQKASLTEKHALEKQLMSLQEKLQDDATKKEHDEFMKQIEEERLEMAEASQQMTEALQGNIQSLSVYLESCQMKKERVSQQLDCLVREFQAIKLPSVKAKYLKFKKQS